MGLSIDDRHSVSADWWSCFAANPERNLTSFIPKSRLCPHANEHTFNWEDLSPKRTHCHFYISPARSTLRDWCTTGNVARSPRGCYCRRWKPFSSSAGYGHPSRMWTAYRRFGVVPLGYVTPSSVQLRVSAYRSTVLCN